MQFVESNAHPFFQNLISKFQIMKKTYIIPNMVTATLQQQGFVCESLQGLAGNANINYVGSDEDYVNGGGTIRTKELSSLWDIEW